MIVGIKGEVVYKEPTILHIFINGLIYEVNVSLNTSNRVVLSDNIELFTTYIVREDAHLLYGFLTKDEKKMFDTLLKINGIGPKVALAVCSTFAPETFAKIIASKDVNMLKKVPGIGPKAASRILVELDSFIEFQSSSSNVIDESYNKALLALESLGFKKDAIKKALKDESGSTEELVKIALKKLQRL